MFQPNFSKFSRLCLVGIFLSPPEFFSSVPWRNFLNGSRRMVSEILSYVSEKYASIFSCVLPRIFSNVLSHASHRTVYIFFLIDASWRIFSKISRGRDTANFHEIFLRVLEGVIFRIFNRFPSCDFFFGKFLEGVSVNILEIVMEVSQRIFRGAFSNAPLANFLRNFSSCFGKLSRNIIRCASR